MLPKTKSFLMDQETLLTHQDRWTKEPTPTGKSLNRLSPEELMVYSGLVENRWASLLRLEQERLGFDWIHESLLKVLGDSPA